MKYICEVCGYVYDPAEGDPDSGIEPGIPMTGYALSVVLAKISSSQSKDYSKRNFCGI